jgi:hypothetical protein
MSAVGQFQTQLSGYDAAAAVSGIAGDADVHTDRLARLKGKKRPKRPLAGRGPAPLWAHL